MKNIRQKNYWYILLLLVCSMFLVECNNKTEDIPTTKEKEKTQGTAAETMQKLWETSPLVMSAEREKIFSVIQHYVDDCSKAYFKDNYMKSTDAACENMERYDPILTCYRLAFDRVLEGIKTETVEEGTVVIWALYNMGVIIKTPSACFGIDIYHRWALKLAPYLDFLCTTHDHADHRRTDLMQAMFDANKPVLSNFFKKGTSYAYTSTSDKNYTIGKFSIRTAITDHNGTAEGKDFVTVFRIDCGDDTGHFTFLHVGDSNFQPAQYTNVQGSLDVYIPRYSPDPHVGNENRVIGTGSGQVQPTYVLLSHIQELGHDAARWSFEQSLFRASIINCEQTYVPFWGEKLIWKNGALH